MAWWKWTVSGAQRTQALFNTQETSCDGPSGPVIVSDEGDEEVEGDRATVRVKSGLNAGC